MADPDEMDLDTEASPHRKEFSDVVKPVAASPTSPDVTPSIGPVTPLPKTTRRPTESDVAEHEVAAEMQKTGLPREQAAKKAFLKPPAQPITKILSSQELVAVIQQVSTQKDQENPPRRRGKGKKTLAAEAAAAAAAALAPTSINTTPSIFDIQASAEEQVNKGRYIERLSTMIDDLDRAAFSPNIALDALQELIRSPRRRTVQLRLLALADGYMLQLHHVEEVDQDEVRASTDRAYQDVQMMSSRTYNEARRLAIHGFHPILERIIPAPSGMNSRYRNWLRNAATTLAARLDPDFFIQLQSPKILIDANTSEVMVKLQLSGYDPVNGKPFQGSRSISVDSIPDVTLPTHPLHARFNWSEPSLEDVGPEQGQRVMATKAWELAKIITAAFDGFTGDASLARRNIDTMVTRYASRSAHAPQAFARLASLSDPYPIDNIIPWELSAMRRGKIAVTVKKEILDSDPWYRKCNKYRAILNIQDLGTLLEVLDSMLLQLVTGSSVTKILEAAVKTADIVAGTEGAEEADVHNNGVSTRKICDVKDRADHWHTCSGCLRGRPCNRYQDRSTIFMLCNTCVESRSDVAWRLSELIGFSDPDMMSRAGSSLLKQLALHMNFDFKHFNLSDEEKSTEINEAWTNLVRIFGTNDPKEWYDLYIKDSILAEDVAKAVDWRGHRYSAHTPSVEAVRPIFFRNGILRSHCDGNMGSTAVSVNRVLGGNIKTSLKAIHQLLGASNELQERSAIYHILKYSIIKVERTLNARIQGHEERGLTRLKLGLPTTPYLAALSRSSFEGELAIPRYVPNEAVFTSLQYQMAANVRTAQWRPDNYHTYLQQQIELVAQRYGLAHQDQRNIWTMTSTASGDSEVPFIFSKLSHVETWFWHTFYEWSAQRLKTMKTKCDNHSIQAYKDDPAARKQLQIEQFILTLLHLFMSMVVANRDGPRQYPGQRLRALDAGGFEQLFNIRNPLSLSVAHFEHGAAMVTGYADLAQLPVEQGEETFVLDRCNIRLESWLVNVARFSSNSFDELQLTIDQFKSIRIAKDEFLPEAPAPYPPGNLVQFDEQAFSNLLRQPIAAADRNFCFSKRSRMLFGRWIPPARVPELHEATGLSDDESDDEEEEEEDYNDDKLDPEKTDDQNLDTIHPAPNDTVVQVSPPRPSKSVTTLQTHSPVDAALSDNRLLAGTYENVADRPRAANLARDISTCFVSAPVQILHKLFPLRTYIKSLKMTPERRADLLSRYGKNKVAMFDIALNETQAVFRALELFAASTQKVPQSHVISFRDAFNQLSIAEGSSDKEGDWRRKDADANDFINFILKQLSMFAHSKQSDDDIAGNILGQPHFLTLGSENLVSVESHASTVRQMYETNSNDSMLHKCYTAQAILEEQCNNLACKAIARTHTFEPAIRLQMTPDMVGSRKDVSRKDVSLQDLKWHFSHGEHKPDACRSCEECEKGKMTGWGQRLVNLPNILMLSIQRVIGYDDQGEAIVATNRIASRDIMSFRPNTYLMEKLFSESDEPATTSDRYQLVAMIMYQHMPPHYVAFIREDSDHAGPWVCYDDTEDHPKYDTPFSSRYDQFAETLLIYRKGFIAPDCDDCTRNNKKCLHNDAMGLDHVTCYEFLEHCRVRGIKGRNFGLSNSEISIAKSVAQDYEDLMGFENLTQFTELESQKQIVEQSSKFSDSAQMELRFDDGSVSGGPQSVPSNESPSSEASTVVRRGRSPPLRIDLSSSPEDDVIRSHRILPKPFDTSAFLANSLKDAYSQVDQRHAALTARDEQLSKREQQLHDDMQELTRNRVEFERELTEYNTRTLDLANREQTMKEREHDLLNRQHQLNTSTESPLTRLRTVLGELSDDDALEALRLVQQFQLRLVQGLQSRAIKASTAIPPAREASPQGQDSSTLPLTTPYPQAQALQHHHGEAQGATAPTSPTVQESSPVRSALRRNNSQETIKSVRFEGEDTLKGDQDQSPPSGSPLTSSSDENVDHGSEMRKRARNRLTPDLMNLSPVTKRSKTESSPVRQDIQKPFSFSLPRRDPQATRNLPTLLRTDSQRSLTRPTLTQSPSHTSLTGQTRPTSTLNPTEAHASLGGPKTPTAKTQTFGPPPPPKVPAVHAPTLRSSDSRASLRTPIQPTKTLKHSESQSSLKMPSESSSRGGRLIKKVRNFTGSSLFFPNRDRGRPQPRTSQPVPTAATYNTITSISAVRTQNGETELLVTRAGLVPSWEALTRVNRDAPQLVQDFLQSQNANNSPS